MRSSFPVSASLLRAAGALAALLSLLAGPAPGSAGEDPVARDERPPAQRVPLTAPFNVLLFVLDDLGVEQLSLYDEINGWAPGYPYAPTPNIDALAAEGVTFTAFHGAPVCSPFRASVLSGQRVHKHRLGLAVNAASPAHLGHVETKLLTSVLNESPVPVELACVGKWHLGPGDDDPGHPYSVGRFTTYGGKLENPDVGPRVNGLQQNWMNYRYTDIAPNGVVTQLDMTDGMHLQVAEYQITRSFMAAHGQRGSTFFLFSSLHFTHGPYSGSWLDPLGHVDPVEERPFHGYGPRPSDRDPEAVEVIRMMTETCDTMIGGILGQLSPAQRARTVVILCSDNGTDRLALEPEHSPSVSRYNTGAYDPARFKHSLYQGGIRVPLVIWGGAETGIRRGVVSDALCEAPDLHATIAEAFGLLESVDPRADGVSLWPILSGEASEVRSHVFAQLHEPNGGTLSTYTQRTSAVVNQARWKLIDSGGACELYDLERDPFEQRDRMGEAGGEGEARVQYLELRAALVRILAEARP